MYIVGYYNLDVLLWYLPSQPNLKRQILSRICYKFLMPERQQISHRVCNIWRCRQTAARNMIKPADMLCQQIGGRNRAGFTAPARFLLPVCRQIARGRRSCSVSAADLLSLYEQVLSTEHKQNRCAVDLSLLTCSDQICCQSADILLTFCWLGLYMRAYKHDMPNINMAYTIVTQMISFTLSSIKNVFARNTVQCHNNRQNPSIIFLQLTRQKILMYHVAKYRNIRKNCWAKACFRYRSIYISLRTCIHSIFAWNKC